MREYKFRAWDKVHNEMIEWEQYKDEMVSNDFWDKDLVVMEYTGLKDKNGKDIYEGDIIEFKPWNKEDVENYIIRYINDDATFRGIKQKKNSTKVISLINSEQGLRVVGNIFENKELLEYEN